MTSETTAVSQDELHLLRWETGVYEKANLSSRERDLYGSQLLNKDLSSICLGEVPPHRFKTQTGSLQDKLHYTTLPSSP